MSKKKLLAVALVMAAIMVLLPIFAIALVQGWADDTEIVSGETTENASERGFDIQVDPNREILADRSAVQQITEGMWVGDVYSIMGMPQRDVGSGLVILEWDLNTGEVLKVPFIFDTEKNDWYVICREVQFDFQFDPDREDLPTREMAEKIVEGMSVGEAYEIMGKPQRDIGSGLFVLEWELDTGERLIVSYLNDINSREYLAMHCAIK